MKNFDNVKPKITELANEILTKHNLRVYEVNNIVKSEFENDILQILIENSDQPNAPLDFDTLAIVNEDISLAMDKIDSLTEPYLLEIASGGIEKPIRNVGELNQALHQFVHVVFNNPINGLLKTNATVIGIYDDLFEIEYFIKGQKKKSKIKWTDISQIRYAVNF